LRKKPSDKDIPILKQQIQIQFTPGSDEIMAGSYLLLDKLGETMTSFGANGFANRRQHRFHRFRRCEPDVIGTPRNFSEKLHPEKFHQYSSKPFSTIGRGSANPIAPNTSEAGRQQNRRTDIKVILATQ